MKSAKIYKIELPDGKIYIGSTTRTIPQRQSGHNRDLIGQPHRNLYAECVKQNITRIKCIWVEDVTVNSNCELRAREEYFRKLLNCELNSKRCYMTVEDRQEENKQYHNNNKEEINRKRNVQIECELCNCKVNRSTMSRHQRSNKCKKLSKLKLNN